MITTSFSMKRVVRKIFPALLVLAAYLTGRMTNSCGTFMHVDLSDPFVKSAALTLPSINEKNVEEWADGKNMDTMYLGRAACVSFGPGVGVGEIDTLCFDTSTGMYIKDLGIRNKNTPLNSDRIDPRVFAR